VTAELGDDRIPVLSSQDLQPPKNLNIEVHVLKDVGEVMLPSGAGVTMTKGDRLLLRRSDVEQLIRQGLVEETND
jgi:GINS complex subunit 1